QAHRVEEARADIILADVDLRLGARWDDALVVAVVGIDADVRESRRDHARYARELVGHRFRLRPQLRPAHFLDLEDVIALVAGVDVPRVDGLAVDHRGAD